MSDFLITCTKENLLKGLSRVAPIAGRNSQLPILGHVLMQSKKGALHLTTTDLEIGTHTLIGGKIEGDGAAALPARAMLSYVSQLPSDNPITVHVKNKVAHISTTGFAAQFPVGSAEDFPLMPKGEKEDIVTIDAGGFCGVLDQVLFSAARDETRPEIRGVYVSVQGGVVRAAATDSFRLAEDAFMCESDTEISFILPLPSAQEIVRLFTGQEEISLALHDGYILLFSDEVDVTSRLVDGQYPDYQQIIPKGAKTTLKISRDDILQALKTLTVFLPRESRRVELEVNSTKKTLSAQVASGGAGEGRVDIPADVVGEDVKVVVNIQYLIEGLQHLMGKECELGFSGEMSPLVVRSPAKDLRYLYVVMPIRA